MPIRRALWILIVASTTLRLFSACYLGLGNDEAYHWLYATHPALGYYDHPPMMAWIEMLGLCAPRGRSVDLGNSNRLHRTVCRLNLAARQSDGPILR